MRNSDEVKFPLKEFYSQIFRRYDLVNRLFTVGMDCRWRKDAAKICLSYNPEQIIDLCCGTGDVAIKTAQLSNDDVKIIGLDFNSDMLDYARIKASKKSLKSIEFVQGDAANIPFNDHKYDCMTIAFGFRNLCYENPQRDKHIMEMNRVLKKGGKLIILESGVPSNPVIKLFYKMYLHLVLIPLGGLLSGNWNAYKYLAKSAENFYSIDEIKQLLIKSGFEVLMMKQFFIGSANLIVAEKQAE
jgi:demethylmenaquinone methyltransferase/2-methoxy-6-polyprenyl-1,4-benzoquinol methylase